MLTGAFIVSCSPGASPLVHIHSSMNTFFKASLVGIQFYHQSTLCVTFLVPWDNQVLVWHHCHHVFTSCSARQSRPLPFFPPGCTFSMVKKIACCPCHLVRVTSTLVCWQSGENCQAVAAGAFMLPTRCLLDVSRPLRLTLRPSAPVCCCHRDSLTRGRLAFAQEAVRGLLLFPLFGSAPVGCARWFQAAGEKCLFKRC